MLKDQQFAFAWRSTAWWQNTKARWPIRWLCVGANYFRVVRTRGSEHEKRARQHRTRDFVTFPMLRVKHAVIHRPKTRESVENKQMKDRAEDIRTTRRVDVHPHECTTVQLWVRKFCA